MSRNPIRPVNSKTDTVKKELALELVAAFLAAKGPAQSAVSELDSSAILKRASADAFYLTQLYAQVLSRIEKQG